MSTPNITSTNQEINKLKLDKPLETETKNSKSVTGIAIMMTKAEAEAEGGAVLDLFLKLDTDKSGKIENKEFSKYILSNQDIQEKAKQLLKLPPEEQGNVVIKEILKLTGVGTRIDEALSKFNTDEPKKDIDTIAKETLGLDLSEYTEEEKIDVLFNEINKKYAFSLENKGSVYATHYNRLKEGNLTPQELELLGGRKNLNEEQLALLAQGATRADAMVDLTTIFATGNDDVLETGIKGLGKINDSLIQTSMVAVSIYAANDKATQEKLAKIIKDSDIKLTDTNNELFDMATLVLFNKLGAVDSLEFTTQMKHFNNKVAQYLAFENIDVAEKGKVENGDITQEEYNKFYSEEYAASAHKIELASKAYKYVTDNANDENRTATMNTLASYVYQIEDSSERSKAVKGLQTSGYYTKSVDENLKNSQAQYIADSASKTQANGASGSYSYYQVDNMLFEENPAFLAQIQTVMSGGNELEKENFISDTITNVNNNKGLTKKQYEMGLQRGIQLLRTLIQEDEFQGSKYENLVIAKLHSLPTATLRTLLLGSKDKTQNYFFNKGLLEKKDLIGLGKSDEKRLSASIQQELAEYKAERQIT